MGGCDEYGDVDGKCFIYDYWCNRWSSTPAAVHNVSVRRYFHTLAVLGDNIVVVGGRDGDGNELSSIKCIDVNDLLQYAPLYYPLPDNLFDHMLLIGKE
mmetsp:Transcript_10152/g.15218  ORF Transcript_10152/g.15218 Transcript_10152/m.15218 type:complete len:99 (+) Transcript_10152:121-417(+)